MQFEDDYYRLLGRCGDETNGAFRIALLSGCGIYRGHFPGHPVCPGVCNMQVIKECAERMTGKRLHIGYIRRCRLTAVATPAVCSVLEVKISLQPTETGYRITATLADAQRTYMEYKGDLAAYGEGGLA